MKPLLHALALSLAAASLAAEAPAQYFLPASPEPHLVFEAPVTTTLGTALDVDLADVDGDGRDDLLAASAAAVTWRPGLGGGMFGAPAAIPDSGGLQVLEPCDLDGDGHVDLVGATGGATGVLHVALGDGAGGFDAPVSYGFRSNSFFGELLLIAADADGDGDTDLTLSATPDFIDPNGGYLAVYVNDGTGALAPEVVSGPLLQGSRARAADFDGNGIADLLVTGWTGVGSSSTHRVLLGQPGGGFTEVAPLFGEYLWADVADLDADGIQDVVVSTQTGAPGFETSGHATWMGAGDGTFSHLADSAFGGLPHVLDHGDVDGDGILDLVVVHWADAWILAGAGDGTTAPTAAVSLTGFTGVVAARLELAELDGDGKLDVAMAVDLGTPDATLFTSRNVTYPAGGPLADWGGSKRGANGFPKQVVSGTLVPGTPFSVALDQGRPSGQASWIIGLEADFVPFKGGVLVPQLDQVVGPLPLDGAGSLDLSLTWPAGLPPGQTVDLQFWIPDPWANPMAATTDAHLVQP
ncbi:MAG TPA: VCBS repeat-containing protein [Planctomycetota bacterium]|nr:VCBS repeat-containing protein [Planctomycetota bacterium]